MNHPRSVLAILEWMNRYLTTPEDIRARMAGQARREYLPPSDYGVDGAIPLPEDEPLTIRWALRAGVEAHLPLPWPEWREMVDGDGLLIVVSHPIGLTITRRFSPAPTDRRDAWAARNAVKQAFVAAWNGSTETIALPDMTDWMPS